MGLVIAVDVAHDEFVGLYFRTNSVHGFGVAGMELYYSGSMVVSRADQLDMIEVAVC